MANFLLETGKTYQARIWQSWGANQSEEKVKGALALLGAGGVHVYPSSGDLPSDWPVDKRTSNAPPPAVTTWVEFVWPLPSINVDLEHPGIETKWYVGDIWEKPLWVPAEPPRKGSVLVPAALLGGGVAVAAAAALADRRVARGNPSAGATVAWSALAGGLGMFLGSGLGYVVGLWVGASLGDAGVKQARTELGASVPVPSDTDIEQSGDLRKLQVRARYVYGNNPWAIFWSGAYSVSGEQALTVWAQYWARTLQGYYGQKWGVYPGLVAVDVIRVDSHGVIRPEAINTIGPPWVARV